MKYLVATALGFGTLLGGAGAAPVHVKPLDPESNPWAKKGIDSQVTFGATYTRKNIDADWHERSRTDEFADVAVRFGDGPGELVFGRATSYLPVWKHGSKTAPNSAFPEKVKRSGNGPDGRPDNINRHARARIIESTGERVVIHWRYLPQVPEIGPDSPPDQTRFVDEYFVIFPNRSVVRAVWEGLPQFEEWQAAAPGRLFRYQLGAGQLSEIAAKAGDKDLMMAAMGLGGPADAPKPAPVVKLPPSFPKPIVELTFDEGSGRVVGDSASGKGGSVEGHSALWKPGVSGTALEFDGWSTRLPVDGSAMKSIGGAFTVDMWVAIAAYPWNACTLLSQGALEGDRVKGGFTISFDRFGKLVANVSSSTGKGGARLEFSEDIPRHEWTRVTMVIDTGKENASALYLNGRKVAEANTKGLSLGLNPDQPLTVVEGGTFRSGKSKQVRHYGFDGAIDELRVYDQALSESQIVASTKAIGGESGKGISTETTVRGFPTDFADTQSFGAHYAHLGFHPSWDRMFRMAGHPDIVVTFDKSPCQYVFWHGTGYIPMLVNEKGFWYSNEFNETWGKSRRCNEPMSDKRVVYNRVHILEQSPARVVLKWRYPLCDTAYSIHGEAEDENDVDWGKWATWYLTIYPDGSMVKRMRVYTGGKRRLEWHESMAIMAPNQKPEDILATRPALSLATSDGTVRNYDWIDAPPTDVDYTDALVHVVNMVGDYSPYTIQRITGGNVYKNKNKGTGYSPFPSWNHWPVAQLPSDRIDTAHPHRAAHSSVTHINWNNSLEYGQEGQFLEKLLLEGMSDQPVDKLLPMAKSWLEPAKAEGGKGVQVVFDPAQRAYVLTRESGQVDTLEVKLAATEDSPLVNPALVVENWGRDGVAKITIDGRPVPKPLDLRQGVVRRANGVNALVIWMELTSNNPLTITIQ